MVLLILVKAIKAKKSQFNQVSTCLWVKHYMQVFVFSQRDKQSK